MIGELPSKRTRVPVHKVRGGSHVEIVVRSRTVFGFHSHWLGKRSFMCPGKECAACEQSIGSRWHGFIAIDLRFPGGREKRFGLLEITESAYGRLEFIRESFGMSDFVGLRCFACRRSQKAPLRFVEADEGESIVAEAKPIEVEFVADASATIYGLPSIGVGQSLKEWERNAIPAARTMIGSAVARLAVI